MTWPISCFVAKHVKVELVGGFLHHARGAEQLVANLVESLLQPPVRVQAAVLLGHLRCGLQTHGDLLLGRHGHVLDLIGDRVAVAHAVITAERDQSEQSGNHQAAEH
jgi:hypothetical protein